MHINVLRYFTLKLLCLEQPLRVTGQTTKDTFCTGIDPHSFHTNTSFAYYIFGCPRQNILSRQSNRSLHDSSLRVQISAKVKQPQHLDNLAYCNDLTTNLKLVSSPCLF